MKLRLIALIIIVAILVVCSFYVYKINNQKIMKESNNNIGNDVSIKSKEIYIHKIVGLGDYVPDKRKYEEACQGPKIRLDKRYSGIINFELMPSDYKEGNAGARDIISRYSAYMGGQYSCLFKGVYSKSFPVRKISGNEIFELKEMQNISFNYPKIEGFELRKNYNSEKGSGEITYFSQGNLIPSELPNAIVPGNRHPMLIIQKMSHPTTNYSIDKIEINPSNVKYKIWNEHEIYDLGGTTSIPYDNLDTTIEFIVSEKEVYLVTTVNFIFNGINEQSVLDVIVKSFKVYRDIPVAD